MSGRAASLGCAFALLAAGCASAPVETEEGRGARRDVERLEAELKALGSRDAQELREQLSAACLVVVDSPETSGKDRLSFAQRAVQNADAAIRLDEERVVGHYLRAIAIGRVLENSSIPDLDLIPALEEAGKRARELDPSYDEGGPARLLALLYQKAPAFPIGPELAGEEDVIDELFREALTHGPRNPENHIDYAEFLLEAKRKVTALNHARTARDLLREATGLRSWERAELERRLHELFEAFDFSRNEPSARRPG